MDFEIKNLSGYEDAWNSYIYAHKYGTPYHLTQWMHAIEDTFRIKNSYYVAVNEQNQVCGILPIFILNSVFFGKKNISIPFSVYGGILSDSHEIESILLNFAIGLTKKNDARFLELRNLHDKAYELEKRQLYITYRKKLKTDEQLILQDIPRKSRASIRNGYKKYHLSAETNNDVNTLYFLYAKNKRKLGSPAYPKNFFIKLLDGFDKNAGILTVFFQEKPVASVLFFTFNNTIFPYFSGSDETYFYTNANNVLYYELMKYAINNGIEIFDFGRSRNGTGSSKFKEFMGFEAQPLHYYLYLNKSKSIPNLTPSNSKFDLVTKLWSRLPLKVTTILGPRVVKYFP